MYHDDRISYQCNYHQTSNAIHISIRVNIDVTGLISSQKINATRYCRRSKVDETHNLDVQESNLLQKSHVLLRRHEFLHSVDSAIRSYSTGHITTLLSAQLDTSQVGQILRQRYAKSNAALLSCCDFCYEVGQRDQFGLARIISCGRVVMDWTTASAGHAEEVSVCGCCSIGLMVFILMFMESSCESSKSISIAEEYFIVA